MGSHVSSKCVKNEPGVVGGQEHHDAEDGSRKGVSVPEKGTESTAPKARKESAPPADPFWRLIL
jgi:hypothetical protein